MVNKEGVRFSINRISGTFKLVVRNKMALVGLIILIGFVFAALGAPLLTPYGPNEKVAGVLAQPSWVMNYPDGYYLSKNVVVPSSSIIASPSDVQSWNLVASPSTLANIQESYTPNIVSSSTSKGSIQLIYGGQRPAAIRLSQTFHVAYHYPPQYFLAI